MTPEALARTYALAFPGERGWTAKEFATLLAAPGACVTGTELAFVLGRALLDEAEIITLATAPGHRRQGLARAALLAFIAACMEQGVTRIFLEVAEDNAPARALYAATKFTEVGRRPRYYARAEAPAADALILELRL